MFELYIDRSGNGIVPDVYEPAEHCTAPDDPEHIKATQRIDRDDTPGRQYWLSAFGHR
jgi:hypothetical protein